MFVDQNAPRDDSKGMLLQSAINVWPLVSRITESIKAGITAKVNEFLIGTKVLYAVIVPRSSAMNNKLANSRQGKEQR